MHSTAVEVHGSFSVNAPYWFSRFVDIYAGFVNLSLPFGKETITSLDLPPFPFLIRADSHALDHETFRYRFSCCMVLLPNYGSVNSYTLSSYFFILSKYSFDHGSLANALATVQLFISPSKSKCGRSDTYSAYEEVCRENLMLEWR